MNDFLVFKTFYGKVAIRKSTITSVYEDDDDDEDIVHIETDDGSDFETNESFDSIISKL
jgi:hypothetical protein